MKKARKLSLFFVLFLALGLVLVACTGGGGQEQPTEAPSQPAAPTEAPAEPAPTEAPAEPAPTEAPAEPAPTEAPVTEEMPAFEPMSVAAESCDYGGKIKSIEAVDELTVQFNLCKPDPAFLAKAAFIPFGIQPKEWLEETGGTGELLEHPIGTGPYMVEEWVRGEQITYKRFEDYWGDPASAETAVLRWNQEGAARLVELQAGTVDYITNVSPDDFDIVRNDPNLVLLPNASPNILYLAMTNTFEPFDNIDVRRAVAMGIDRQRIVDNFYPPGSEAASHFTPCSIPNGCQGDPWYDFDVDAANALLDEVLPRDADGIRLHTAIYYRDVFRSYLPEPGLVAVEFQTQLRDNLGIDAEVIVMESGEFIAESTDGRLDGFYLLGWGADYPHVTNFLDFHFGAQNPQFGDPHPEIYEVLEEASQIANPADAADLYAQANNAIRDLVPMVPIAHGASAHAALASLEGAYVPPFGAAQFYKMDPGKDTLVFMQNNEPISLYCADETDGESLRPCQQAVETLLEYADDSGDVVPELATSCEGNEDATVWTCTLRENVKFHDGSMLDANDVVASWAVGIDAANPNHVGNTGGFDYFSYLWDGLINADQ
ncbi:MAG: ABC transporter substrate-binding protein [Anaerolineae bacterium]